MSVPFLAAIWGRRHGSFGELRLMRDGKIEQAFFDLDMDRPNPFQLVAHTVGQWTIDGWDVYYGVLPRESRGGKAADVYPETSWLWADVDAKRFPSLVPDDQATQKAAALSSITRFHTSPAIIVDSGGGYHAYWRLDKPEPLDRAQAVMAYIADKIGGDSVHDAPRILRVPGTLNFKKLPPRPVRIVRFMGDVVRLGDLEGYLPIPKATKVPYRRHLEATEPPVWLRDLIQDGAPKGQRSEACFKVMLWLIRYGWSYDEIENTFETNPGGIGAKYHEKGSNGGSRWFDVTFKAAEATA